MDERRLIAGDLLYHFRTKQKANQLQQIDEYDTYLAESCWRPSTLPPGGMLGLDL